MRAPLAELMRALLAELMRAPLAELIRAPLAQLVRAPLAELMCALRIPCRVDERSPCRVDARAPCRGHRPEGVGGRLSITVSRQWRSDKGLTDRQIAQFDNSLTDICTTQSDNLPRTDSAVRRRQTNQGQPLSEQCDVGG